jgi:NAD(P)-dependent dehydrogenase (short-subunit alcohol dehydrogenase family)
MSKQPAFEGATAVVTGAGSGIGRALSVELARRGAFVYASDVHEGAVRDVVERIGKSARAAGLDVRDAGAVQSYIDDIEREKGGVDYLFNNAGIGVSGEVHQLTLAHWDRVIDVNLRGVIHGVHAAYPGMVARRSGHIVNTASMAGLSAAPLLTPYAATKHAVVGLSTSLRVEASAYGVGVSALCPGVIETPILDGENPADLPETPWTPNVRDYLTRLAGKPYPVDKLAAEALDAVVANRAIIVIPSAARAAYRFGRLAPRLAEALLRKAVASARQRG